MEQSRPDDRISSGAPAAPKPWLSCLHAQLILALAVGAHARARAPGAPVCCAACCRCAALMPSSAGLTLQRRQGKLAPCVTRVPRQATVCVRASVRSRRARARPLKPGSRCLYPPALLPRSTRTGTALEVRAGSAALQPGVGNEASDSVTDGAPGSAMKGAPKRSRPLAARAEWPEPSPSKRGGRPASSRPSPRPQPAARQTPFPSLCLPRPRPLPPRTSRQFYDFAVFAQLSKYLTPNFFPKV